MYPFSTKHKINLSIFSKENYRTFKYLRCPKFTFTVHTQAIQKRYGFLSRFLRVQFIIKDEQKENPNGKQEKKKKTLGEDSSLDASSSS